MTPWILDLSLIHILFDYFGGNYVTGVDYENALAADDLRFDSANYYRGGEMNAHVEYFEADRYLTYEGAVILSLRKDGNLDYGQKSFLMTGADPVPESSCELYELFRDGTFLLYGGGTDPVSYTHLALNPYRNVTLRDCYIADLAHPDSGDTVHSDGVQIFGYSPP